MRTKERYYSGKKGFTYQYDEATFLKMIEKNEGTHHDKEGFEPVYDWGTHAERNIPKWAESIIQYHAERGHQSGRITRDWLPPILTVQGIAYCTFFREGERLVLRAYRPKHRERRVSERFDRSKFGIKALGQVLLFSVAWGILLLATWSLGTGTSRVEQLILHHTPSFMMHLLVIFGSSIALGISSSQFASRVANIRRSRNATLPLISLFACNFIIDAFCAIFTLWVILTVFSLGTLQQVIGLLSTYFFWLAMWGSLHLVTYHFRNKEML